MEYSKEIFLAILKVVPLTLVMTAISFVLALIIAIIIAVVEYNKIPVLKQIFSVYVSFFRGTPLVPQLFLLYFGIPAYVPALRAFPAVYICIVGLTLNAAAYMKEVVRGSILSVPKGQREAAYAHGMSSMQTMFKIILPQAAMVAIPSLFNNLVDILKGTSVAFTIGVMEMTAVASLRASATFKYLETYAMLMISYWIIVFIMERIQKVIEKRNMVWNVR